MRRVVAGFVVLAAASWIVVSCSSGGGGGGAGSGGSTGSGSGGTSGGGSGGTPGGGSGGGGVPTGDNAACAMTQGLPKVWRDEVPNADCTNCLLNNCCTVIQACNANDACRGIFTCQVACYTGFSPDGAALPEDDAGVDDAGNTARDNCAENCFKSGSQAGQEIFEPADECFNGLLPNQCGKMEVCD